MPTFQLPGPSASSSPTASPSPVSSGFLTHSESSSSSNSPRQQKHGKTTPFRPKHASKTKRLATKLRAWGPWKKQKILRDRIDEEDERPDGVPQLTLTLDSTSLWPDAPPSDSDSSSDSGRSYVSSSSNNFVEIRPFPTLSTVATPLSSPILSRRSSRTSVDPPPTTLPLRKQFGMKDAGTSRRDDGLREGGFKPQPEGIGVKAIACEHCGHCTPHPGGQNEKAFDGAYKRTTYPPSGYPQPSSYAPPYPSFESSQKHSDHSSHSITPSLGIPMPMYGTPAPVSYPHPYYLPWPVPSYGQAPYPYFIPPGSYAGYHPLGHHHPCNHLVMPQMSPPHATTTMQMESRRQADLVHPTHEYPTEGIEIVAPTSGKIAPPSHAPPPNTIGQINPISVADAARNWASDAEALLEEACIRAKCTRESMLGLVLSGTH